MIKVGVIGAGGYTGGELLRLLAFHPKVVIAFAQSNSQAGKAVATVHDRPVFFIQSSAFGRRHFLMHGAWQIVHFYEGKCDP